MTVDFLRALWPDEGYYCLAFPGQHGFIHKVFDTIEAAADYALLVRGEQNVFFCLHTLAARRVWEGHETDPRSGKSGKWTSRKHANMVWAKCFFADLDVGEDTKTSKKFASQADALRALSIFLNQTGLPWPTITSSGRGCHIFWPLDEKISTEDWKPYATKLKQLMRHHQLRADPTRTSDESSVLRVAGTLHLKDKSDPRPVEVLSTAAPSGKASFLALLDAAHIRAGLDAPLPATDGRRHNISDAPITSSGPPPTIAAVGKACAQVRWLVRNAAELNNSQWYQGIVQTFRLVEDGRDVIDAVSAQHGDRLGRVDEKILQLETGNIGPTTCVKMEELCGTGLCAQCPFFGKVKAPLAAARQVVVSLPPPVVAGPVEEDDKDEEAVTTATIPIPPPPYPWSRTPEGIKRARKGKDGDETNLVVYDMDLYPLRPLANDANRVMQSEWRATLPKGRGEVDFLVDTTALYDPRGLIDATMNTGMVIKPENLNHMRDYMLDYIKELQRYVDDSKQFSHFGWTNDHKAFILADKTLTAGAIQKSNISPQARSAAEHVGAKGELARQIELMRFYNRPEWVGHQFLILCSLGSPLLYATGQDGVVVNASGDSGASKSTALYAGASFWGEPKQYTINGTNRAVTALFRNQRMATLANLPCCVDEITHMANEDVHDMVMNATQPDPNRRGMRVDLTERRTIGCSKSMIMICSANSSLNEKLSIKNQAGTAGSMRTFEMFFREVNEAFKPAADDFLRELRQNYGHIGEEFMKIYLANQAAYEDRIREQVREIDRTERMRVSERFWSAVIAVVLVAGEIARDAGLLAYDPDAIWAWLRTYQIPKMRGIITSSYVRPIDVLSDYIDKITPDILVVNKNAGNIYAPKGVRTALTARLELHSSFMWLHRQTFKEYCQRTGANMTQVVESLVQSKVIVNDRVLRTLGAGTEYAHGQTWCLQIDMQHPDMTEKVDSAAAPQANRRVIPLVRK